MKIRNLRMNLAMRTVVLLLLLGAAGLTNAFSQQYDFSATVGNNTLYFKITDNTNNYVQVVSPKSYGWDSETEPTGSLEVPATISDGTSTYSVTSIDDYAFQYCTGLTSLELNVPSVGMYAFYGCANLESLTIGEDVAYIGGYAFRDCTSLASVAYNATDLTANSNYVFYGCSHSCTLTIGSNVTALPSYLFRGFTGLNNVSNWGGVTDIGSYTFSGCGFTSMTIPDAITSMGSYAFADCTSLATLTFGSGLSTVGNYTFQYCTSLGSLTWGSVTSIGNCAFSYCTGLTSLVLNVPTVGSNAFEGCTNLESLTIGEDVAYIGGYAFYSCTSLATVMVLRSESVPESGYGIFDDTPNTMIIYVPGGMLSAYKSAWSAYSERIQGWLQKSISGYSGSGSWAFIASPLTTNTAPTAIDNMIAETPADYDLYYFDQTGGDNGKEWKNYKAHSDNFTITNGQGYLYANAEDVNLFFKGTFNENATEEVGLTYDDGKRLAGWNLVGNPFPVNAYLINRSYYVINEAGTAVSPTPVSDGSAIEPCTGVMVKAEANETNPKAIFSKTAQQSTANNGKLRIALSQVPEPVEGPARGSVAVSTGSTTLTLDNAIITFNEDEQLGKFYFGEQDANIYIPQDGEEYAIACVSAGTDVARNVSTTNEMSLYFKAKMDGTYTLTVNPEGVEMGYLHLIDNMTGADVDVLAAGPSTGSGASYTFTAKTTDYESRFRLVFAPVCGDVDGDDEAFAFVSNGNIIVNGEGVLQIVDVMGRVVRCSDGVHTVSTTGMTPGVYVLRLINGNDVKTQKIVIE